MNDELKLLIGLALLGGIGYIVYRNQMQPAAETVPQLAYDDGQDVQPVPVESPVVVKPVAPVAASVPVTASTVAREKVVPIKAAVKYPAGANPLNADPADKKASKAYRINGVNYWLVTLPDGRRDYYSDAEISRTPAAKKVV